MAWLKLACYVISLAVTQAAITHLSDDDRQRIVDRHNEARRAEPAAHMPDLVWLDDLERVAQAWTDKCVFRHQNNIYGENLATIFTGHKDNSAAIDAMVGMWLQEKQYTVNGSFTECCSRYHHQCCHLTQMLWARTTRIGCGLTLCPSLDVGGHTINNAAYIACEYNPPGNNPVSHCEWDWRPYIPA